MFDKSQTKFLTPTGLQNLLEYQRSQHIRQFPFTPFKQNLKLAVKNLRLQSKNKRNQISAAWKEISYKIEQPILKNTEVLSFRSGILKIAVPRRTQLFEIEHFHRDNIILKLREHSNFTIIKISFELKSY